MSFTGQYRKARRVAMWMKDKRCHWCGIETVEYPSEADFHLKGLKTPENMSTLDHLISRFHRKKGEDVEKVIACWKCNQKRAREENHLNKENGNNI